jgi:hypothetical protein
MQNITSVPDTAVEKHLTVPEIVDKRGYAARWSLCVRTIDNYLKAGLPHLRLGQRRIRIVVKEADEWMRKKFGV